ncbi:phosphoribosylanthranilate isomerase [Sphaerotilus sp.]|uniref:phosphoribosylanthranilate isomerase n=1 Tax=Sphaerotilus sp. TaxID=2093942 RepID=UPI002ACE0B8D|nr:phosphoribosylanthranilate isomerase [Sphaerotilus sp.]MDZ7855969.1 phosphoribosylanthranilate isomerase [Sphaerotilus sp.]
MSASNDLSLVASAARTRIKICGLTRERDVDEAVAAGADAIGLVFYARSPRHVSLDRAVQLARRLPPFVTPVGLFVNAEPAQIAEACAAIPTLLLQFHGDETLAQCEAPARPYLRAARMVPGFDLLDFAQSYSSAQAILLDAHVEGYGGGGKVFDWSLIPSGVHRPVVLSGGLNAANVTDGVLRVRPCAVDVSSGVEIGKGVKDAALMHQFCEAVREADARRADADSGY